MVNRVTELTHRVDSAELASRRGVTSNSHRRRLTGKSTAATRRQLLGSERMVAGHGGSGERRSETIPGGAWTTRARTSKLWTVRTVLSRLRLRRGWWLRLRLGERNTMVVLHARNFQRLGRYDRFTKTPIFLLHKQHWCSPR